MVAKMSFTDVGSFDPSFNVLARTSPVTGLMGVSGAPKEPTATIREGGGDPALWKEVREMTATIRRLLLTLGSVAAFLLASGAGWRNWH
jgi:hypothetical protein